MIQDTYEKTGEKFLRPKNGKEVRSDISHFFKSSWRQANFIYINLFIFVIYIISAFSNFNWGLMTNILYSSVTIGITAIGMALIIIGGDIDLSAGSIFALDAGISALIYNAVYGSQKNAGLAIFVTLIFAMAFGFFLGAVNGFFVGHLKMPSFIVTLATMLIYRSLIVYTLSAQPGKPSTFRLNGYGSANDPLYALGSLSFASISLIGILFILLVALFYLIATQTKFGRKIYAVGSNRKAASLIGINVANIRFLVFAIEGLLIGFSAYLQLGIRGNIDPSAAGRSYELYAIASNVLGGISMAGGSGNIIGVLFGALAFQTIDKIIAALHLNANLNDTIKGIILLAAVVFQILKVSPENTRRLLVRLHLVFDMNLDISLESKKQAKVDKIQRKSQKEIRKILADTSLSQDEAKRLCYQIFDRDKKEEELLSVTYQNRIDAAKESIRIEKEKREEKARKAALKKTEENEKAYQESLKKPQKEDSVSERENHRAERMRALSDKVRKEEKESAELEERVKAMLQEYEKETKSV